MKKYAYSFDNEEFFGDLDSEKEAIDEAVSELDPDFVNLENTIFVGVKECYKPKIDGERVIDQLTDQAYDEAGEYSINYLDNIKDDELEELEKELTKTFNKWAKKYKYEPTFFLVKNAKEIKLD